MNKLSFSRNVISIAKDYAHKYALTLPLSPEQLLNAVAEYCEDNVGNKIYFGDTVIGVKYNVGDVRIARDYNVYQYDGAEWVLQGNIKGEKGEPGERGEKGEKGDPGTRGENGLDYFFYTNITNLGKVPVAGDGFSIISSFVNRTPQIDDRFIAVFKYKDRSFLATCRVDTANHAIISLVVETTGSSGSSSKIYRHYITDDQDNRITIFTNSGAEMTEWGFGDGTIILSFGKSFVSGNDGVLLYLDETDTNAPSCVFLITDGTVTNESLGMFVSDEVTEV